MICPVGGFISQIASPVACGRAAHQRIVAAILLAKVQFVGKLRDAGPALISSRLRLKFETLLAAR